MALLMNFLSLTTQIDFRDMQEIPNSQEIFVYRDSGASIIIDILQRVNVEDSGAAAKFVLSYSHATT
jgi:hypothetical protein